MIIDQSQTKYFDISDTNITCKKNSKWRIALEINYTFFTDDDGYNEVILCLDHGGNMICENRTPIDSYINNINIDTVIELKENDTIGFRLLSIKNNFDVVNHSINISKIQCLLHQT